MLFFLYTHILLFHDSIFRMYTCTLKLLNLRYTYRREVTRAGRETTAELIGAI